MLLSCLHCVNIRKISWHLPAMVLLWSCYPLARSCYSPVTLLLISCYQPATLLLLSQQSPATFLALSCQCPVTVLRPSCESPGTFLVLSCCPLACKNSNHWKIPAQGPNNGERNRAPPLPTQNAMPCRQTNLHKPSCCSCVFVILCKNHFHNGMQAS